MESEQISSRHEGDAGGTLAPFAHRDRVVVRVTVPDEYVTRIAVQHCLWMIVNLLVRTDGIVTEVRLRCSPSAELAGRVVPFGSSSLLRARILAAANLLGRVCVVLDDGSVVPHREIVIAPSREEGVGDVLACGSGWWGGAALRGAAVDWSEADLLDANPVGPYFAATLAVAEVYLRARHSRLLRSDDPSVYGWDCWNGQRTVRPMAHDPLSANLDGIALAGVGAVGTAFMQTLWAHPSVTGTVPVVDADEEGVSTSNLNRGVVFTRDDIGRPKADVAAEVLKGDITWVPLSGRYESQDLKPTILVSCVDKNRARDSLQATYPPAILGGSTENLRAEVLLVGKPGVGACLRCYNEPERNASDVEVNSGALMNASIIDSLASQYGETTELVENRLRAPGCDEITDSMLAWLRANLDDDSIPRFAVGFVSVAAGVMLAAEVIRLLNAAERSSKSISTRFQFFRPSRANGPVRESRDSSCPRCVPGSIPTKIWMQKAQSEWQTWTDCSSA